MLPDHGPVSTARGGVIIGGEAKPPSSRKHSEAIVTSSKDGEGPADRRAGAARIIVDATDLLRDLHDVFLASVR